jgi:hypothetical protein
MPAHTDDVLKSIVDKVKGNLVTLLFALPAFGVMTGWIFKDLSAIVELDYGIALRSFSVLYFSLPLLVLALSQITLHLKDFSNDKTRQSLILKISIISLIVIIQLLCTLCSKAGGDLFTIGLIINSCLLLFLIVFLLVHYYTDRDTEPSLPMIAVLCTVLMIHISLGFPWDFGTSGNWIWGVSWFVVCVSLNAMPVAKRKKRRTDDDKKHTVSIVESIGIGIVFVVLIVVALPTYEKAPVFWTNNKNKDTESYRVFSDSSYNATFSNYANLRANGDYYSWITKMYPELSRLWMINRGRTWEQAMVSKKEKILNSLLARACFISNLPKNFHKDIIRNNDLRDTLQRSIQKDSTVGAILNIIQPYSKSKRKLKSVTEDDSLKQYWKLYCDCQSYYEMVQAQFQPLLDRVVAEHKNNALATFRKLKAGKDSLHTLLSIRDHIDKLYYTENDVALLSFYHNAAESSYKEYETQTASQIKPILKQIQWRGIFIFSCCLVLFLLFRSGVRKSVATYNEEQKEQDKKPSEQERIIRSLQISRVAKKEAIEKLRIEAALGAKNVAEKRLNERLGSIDASILILALLAVPLLISIKEETPTKDPYWFITLPNWYLPATIDHIANSSTTFHHNDTYVQKQDLEPMMQALQDLQVKLEINSDSVEHLRGLVVENLDTAKNIRKLGMENIEIAKNTQRLGVENLDTAKSALQSVQNVKSSTDTIQFLNRYLMMSKNNTITLLKALIDLKSDIYNGTDKPTLDRIDEKFFSIKTAISDTNKVIIK